MDITNNPDPTVFAAVWRHRWLVVASVGAGLLLALFLLSLQYGTPDYEAVATVEVEDPSRNALLFQTVGQSPDRYVADQVLILRSPGIAARAVEIARREGASALGVADLLTNSRVLAQPGTDVIGITFNAADPQVAIIGANALASAYQELRLESSQHSAAAALSRLDSAIAVLDGDINDIQQEIPTLNANLPEFNNRIQANITELLQLMAELDSNLSVERRANVLTRVTELQTEMAAIEQVRRIQSDDPALSALRQQQDNLVELRSELAARRVELEIELEQASTGVATLSSATQAILITPSAFRLLPIGVVLGGLIGVGLAYLLTVTRRPITNRMVPNVILGAPLLGEVPDFLQEELASTLPVRDYPRSTAAEAFRFTVGALDAQTRSSAAKSVAVVSSEVGEGKSVVVVNTALAAAHAGRRVLIIDADFGNQETGRTLGLSDPPPAGLTDIVIGDWTVERALQTVGVPDGLPVSYLGRGTLPAIAPDFFRTSACEEFFALIKDDFDLVLVDTPALLQVAYGSTVAGMADALLVVVRHEIRQTRVEELAERLRFIGAPVLGYVYNLAPLRPFLFGSEGSLKDILGDSGYRLPA